MGQLTSVYLYVDGSYVPYNAAYEYTSPDMTSAWGSAISPFISLYNSISSDGTPTAPTAAQVSAIGNAIEQLVSLAQVGTTSGTSSIADTINATNAGATPSYLTYTMAQDLNQLLVTLEASGIGVTPNFSYLTNSSGNYILNANGQPEINPASLNSNGNLYTVTGLTAQSLTTWQDLAATSTTVQSALASAQNEAQTGDLTLQSLVELEFVTDGNNIITGQLTSLQQELNITQQSLATLTNLQNLHNNVVIDGQSSFSSIFHFSLGRPATMPNITINYNVEAVYQNGGFAQNLLYVAGISAKNASPQTGVTPDLQVVYTGTGGNLIETNLAFPSLYSTTIPNSFISAIANGELVSYGIPKMGIASARIVAYAGIPTTFGTNGFQGFVTVSQVYSDLPTYLQAFYANHENALIPVSQLVKSGLYYAQTDINEPGNITPKVNGVYVRPSAGAPDTGTAINGTYEAIYGKYASAYFGQPIVPALPSSIIYNVSAFMAVKNELVTYRGNLVSAIQALTAVTGASAAADQTSLLSQMETVLSNLNTVFVTPSGQPIQLSTGYLDAYAGFRNWMMDNYQNVDVVSGNNSSTTAGLYQQNITNAITAGSSLNTDQQQQVQNAIYMFEQFYESAATVLQTLTQIITDIAQNISR